MAALTNRSRVDRVADLLSDGGYDAYFAWSPVTLGYLQGFHEGAGERFMIFAIGLGGERRMICPALSEAQARRSGIEDVRSWRDGDDPLVHLETLADDWRLKIGIIAVDDDLPAQLLLKLQAALPAALFKPGQPLVSQLMRNKDEWELGELRAAGRIADDAYDAALPQIAAGMTELQVQDIVEREMRVRGGRPDFCIAAAGANSAEPHHLSDDTVIQRGDLLLLDFGCSMPSGYRSDITRCVAVGEATEEMRCVYDVVYRAQEAGRAAVQPGVAAQEVDRAARRVIEDEGYGESFVHRTGHGLGIRGHEEPYMVEGNAEELAPGQVFSVEPGVYIPGSFGVRIENIVACTETGHESMNREPSANLVVI